MTFTQELEALINTYAYPIAQRAYGNRTDEVLAIDTARECTKALRYL